MNPNAPFSFSNLVSRGEDLGKEDDRVSSCSSDSEEVLGVPEEPGYSTGGSEDEIQDDEIDALLNLDEFEDISEPSDEDGYDDDPIEYIEEDDDDDDDEGRSTSRASSRGRRARESSTRTERRRRRRTVQPEDD